MERDNGLTMEGELGRWQNFLDQPPFDKLIKEASSQSGFSRDCLRKDLICLAKCLRGDEEAVGSAERKLKNNRLAKASPTILGLVKSLECLQPLTLDYIATQFDGSQYLANGDPRPQVSFYVPTPTCGRWVREAAMNARQIATLSAN